MGQIPGGYWEERVLYGGGGEGYVDILTTGGEGGPAWTIEMDWQKKKYRRGERTND